MAANSSTQVDPAVIEAAVAGDEGAFEEIVLTYRPGLHLHCYRMTGSLTEAEDAVQETLLRAWRSISSFGGEGRIGAWLYRIATNAALDLVAKRRHRHLLPPSAGANETSGTRQTTNALDWIEPYPYRPSDALTGLDRPDVRYEAKEAVGLAFIAAGQVLPPRQRAVLLMRDVLGFSAAETAETLDSTVASVNSALQRARASVDDMVRVGQPATSDSSSAESELARSFVAAWSRHDVPAIRALLAEDVRVSMPPLALWWHRRDAFLADLVGPHSDFGHAWQWRSIDVNGQPGYAYWVQSGHLTTYEARALGALTIRDGRVQQITAFVMPELFHRFGLPRKLHPPIT